MASFYLPASSRALAEAIAASSGGEILERPHANALEVHGSRLTVTREMVRADHPGDVDGLLERTTWEMLKRNTNGSLTDTGSALVVEGETPPGAPRPSGGTGCVIAAAALVQVAILTVAAVVAALVVR